MDLPTGSFDVLPDTDPKNTAPDDRALRDALLALLRPLAQLAVARGVVWAVLEDLVKDALVEAARQAHEDLPVSRSVSRISTTLGINRREVTRLLRAEGAPAVRRPTPVIELFTRWRSDASLRQDSGEPRSLPRVGPAPSFESLARGVTLNVHPRSLLDELCRLGLARHDPDRDEVVLTSQSFVPRNDRAAMYDFLGANVGDHLSAAVANVLGDGRRHFEQAVFADELSQQSVEALRPHVADHWQLLMRALVPVLETLIEDDKSAGRQADQRVRVGLYTYGAPVEGSDPSMQAARPARERRLRTRLVNRQGGGDRSDASEEGK
jgi:hypothetical protein